MTFLVTPIILSDFELHCINPITMMTDFLSAGDATYDSGSNEWTLYECPILTPPNPIPTNDTANSTRVYAGYLEFATSCGVSAVNIELDGQLETHNDGWDYIQVYVNGSLFFAESSVQAQYSESEGTYDYVTFWTKPYETVANLTSTLQIPLTPIPCGNIIQINASTGDEIANNNTYWKAVITAE